MALKPYVNVSVDNVRVRPGESLTVWLVVCEHPLKQVQVELNSRMDYKNLDAENGIRGLVSIYTDLGAVEVKDFEEWEPEVHDD